MSIENQGMVVARLYGLEGSGKEVSKDGLELQVFTAHRMRWSHSGAMRLLQGIHPPDVLGPGWIILNGEHTPPGSVSPGMSKPALAKVLKNPSGVSNEEIFKIVWQTTCLSE